MIPGQPPLFGNDATGASEAMLQVCLTLGRLDGRLSHCTPRIAQNFAARIIREALLAVLRQEGHRFTAARFGTWFAGLTTLSDEPLQFAPCPRALVDVALGEFAQSQWHPMAVAAHQLQAANLAPSEPEHTSARANARAAITAAADLVGTIPASHLPFGGLAALHAAIGQSARFALPERGPEVLLLDNWQLVVERERAPSPRWPLELAYGAHLHGCKLLPVALPMIGAIRLDATGPISPAARKVQVDALAHGLAKLGTAYDAAVAVEAEINILFANQRSNSRASQLYALLTAFGPLRTAQIEAMLGATRIGVRSMVGVLERCGVLDAQRVAGAKLYAARPRPCADVPVKSDDAAPLAFSQAALREYETSMADIDALLARYPSGDPDQL